MVIEQSYLGNLFENEEFIRACCKVGSLNHVITSFQLAKQNNDNLFLEQMRSTHRLARQFLDDVELKTLV